jgi:hypothetical protein
MKLLLACRFTTHKIVSHGLAVISAIQTTIHLYKTHLTTTSQFFYVIGFHIVSVSLLADPRLNAAIRIRQSCSFFKRAFTRITTIALAYPAAQQGRFGHSRSRLCLTRKPEGFHSQQVVHACFVLQATLAPYASLCFLLAFSDKQDYMTCAALIPKPVCELPD